MKRFLVCFLAAAVTANTVLGAAKSAPEQDAPPPEWAVWDLTDIYANDAEWDSTRLAVLERIKGLEQYRGTLGNSAKQLYTVLQEISDIQKEAIKVYVYASMKLDEDQRVTKHQEMEQLGTIMFANFGSTASWVEPELLAVGEKKIRKFIKQDARLKPFEFGLDNTLRAAKHTLDAEGEALLAGFSTMLQSPSTIYGLISDSDIPWDSVEMSDGKTYRIDSAGYAKWRGAENRADRKKAFDTYWAKWAAYNGSVGATLNAHIQGQVATAKARKYDSVLQRELNQDNLPEAIYRTLVSEVNAALPTLHRYFKLRGEILGVDQMKYYDIYPPLVSLDKTFDYETSNQLTLDAMAMLGEDWVNRQREGMKQRWVHVYPQQGKRGGAYMNGSVYDGHPYLLLNHQDDYESLSTLAHEWGHAMHTLYSVEAQPFQNYNYATFIAEIPSTSLELILQQHMVKNAATPEEKLFYLGFGLERMRATLFRQTQFAELELALYEAVERGEALTGAKISAMYLDILRRYHGHDEGVVEVDALYANEWMFVPHFYYNMYMYQYATSQTAGIALYQNMVEEGQPAVDRYIDLLRAGGSDYPHNLLKKAGVDLTKPEPFRAAVKRMNLVMDEMEALLKQMK